MAGKLYIDTYFKSNLAFDGKQKNETNIKFDIKQA